MSRFTTEAIRKYRKTFDVFDVDGDGSINEKELRQVATKLGYHLSDRQINNIMRSRDLDNNGSLSFEEFLNAMPGNMVDIPEEDHKDAEVRLKFLEYDKDGNGLVNAAEAHAVLKKELFFTPSQTVSLLNIYDRNKDGHLNYEEFVRFYRRVKTSKEQIQHLFEECDLDKDGTVTLAEIKEVLRRCNLPDDDVDTLLAIHDKNKDGRLQYHEFVQFLLDGEIRNRKDSFEIHLRDPLKPLIRRIVNGNFGLNVWTSGLLLRDKTNEGRDFEYFTGEGSYFYGKIQSGLKMDSIKFPR